MAEEPEGPRIDRGGVLRELEAEDLDGYAVADLRERVERLTAEIARTEAKMATKQSGRSAADALFKF